MADDNSSSILQIWEDLDRSTADDNMKLKVDIIEETLATNSEQPMADDNSSSLQIWEDFDMSAADDNMKLKVDIIEETLATNSEQPMADENFSSLQIWEDLDMSAADDNMKLKVDIIEETLATNSEQPMADDNFSSLQIWEDLDMSTADDNMKFKVDIIEETLQTNSEQPMADDKSSSLQILEDLDMSTADASMMFKVDITEETLQKHSLFIPHRVAVGVFDFLATGGPHALDILNEEEIWYFDIIYDPAVDGFWLSKQWKLFSKYHKLKIHDTVWISVNKLQNTKFKINITRQEDQITVARISSEEIEQGTLFISQICAGKTFRNFSATGVHTLQLFDSKEVVWPMALTTREDNRYELTGDWKKLAQIHHVKEEGFVHISIPLDRTQGNRFNLDIMSNEDEDDSTRIIQMNNGTRWKYIFEVKLTEEDISDHFLLVPLNEAACSFLPSTEEMWEQQQIIFLNPEGKKWAVHLLSSEKCEHESDQGQMDDDTQELGYYIFEEGWESFKSANRLKVGDSLKFYGPCYSEEKVYNLLVVNSREERV